MKKVLKVLLVLLLVTECGCSRKNNEEEVTPEPEDSQTIEIGGHDGADYLYLIKNYTVREKTKEDREDDAAFEEFLDRVFIETMESDFLTMHFSVIDYKALNIEKPPVDCGEISYGFDEENFNYMLDQLKELQSFDYDKLSYRQQYDYESLEYSIYETLASMCYYQYGSLFSSGSCLPENITSNFTDYTFYDKESVDDYLVCLADVDRYFDDCLQYQKDQYADGYGMLDCWVDYTLDVCESTLNKTEDNEYIVSFDKRIDALDFLSEEEKTAYKAQNKDIVLNEILPAYKKIAEEIVQYYNTATYEEYVLKNLDPDYAELTYILQGSANYDLEEVFQQLKDNLDIMESDFVTCYYDEKSYNKLNKALEGRGNMRLVGKECLEYLRQHLNAYYPDLGDVEYTVEELDPDTAPSTVVAYYWPSPVDNTNQNIIRTNPNNMEEGFETYGTLSHEGFPGHLYQNVYYYRLNPHNFRKVISFNGYTEGWAVNAQYFAYQFSGINDDYAARALFFEDAYYFILYAIIDMGVNYFDWTANDIVSYFANESQVFGFSQADAEEIRNFLIEMPGVYCPYGIGSSNFMTLCLNTQKEMGDKFDYVSYHEALLKNGPLPFNILEGAVKEYISENQ